MIDLDALMVGAAVRALEMFEAKRKPAPADEELLTKRQAAALAKVSTATLDNWVNEGALMRLGRGRVWRVRRSDLLSAMASGGRTSSTPDAYEAILKKARR